MRCTTPHPAAGTPENGRRNRIRVAVIDDHPVIHEALLSTFRTTMDLEPCGAATTASEGLQLVQETQPDVVIVDLSLGDAHGLDLVRNLHARYADLRIIVFSMYDEHVYGERVIRAGASGYLMKDEPTSAVLEAIRCVMHNEVYLSRRMASRILARVAKGRKAMPRFATDDLTEREMAVFQMLGEGRSVEEITNRLHLNRKTVEAYRRRAKEKLGYETVEELLQHAVRWMHLQSRGAGGASAASA